MRGRTAVLGLTLLAGLAQGCSESSSAVPQDQAFAACVEDAGLEAPSADASAEAVAATMRRPEVLRCAATELEDEDLRTLMRAAYEEEAADDLVHALRELISSSGQGPQPLAEDTGRLLGALDQDSDAWNPARYETLLAWSVYVETEQEPPGFAEWQADHPDRTGDEAIESYVKEMRSADSGSEAYAAWDALEDIQSEIGQARSEMAGS